MLSETVRAATAAAMVVVGRLLWDNDDFRRFRVDILLARPARAHVTSH